MPNAEKRRAGFLDYMGQIKAGWSEPESAEPRLSRKDKVMEALSFLELEPDGKNGATAEQILARVKRLHRSKIPMFFPRWEGTITSLRASGELIGTQNPEYAVDSDLTRLYRRATEAEKEEFARNRRNDLSRAI